MEKQRSPLADEEIKSKNNSDEGSDPCKEVLLELQWECVSGLLGLCLCFSAEWPNAILKVISASPVALEPTCLSAVQTPWPGFCSQDFWIAKGGGRQCLSAATSPPCTAQEPSGQSSPWDIWMWAPSTGTAGTTVWHYQTTASWWSGLNPSQSLAWQCSPNERGLNKAFSKVHVWLPMLHQPLDRDLMEGPCMLYMT